MRVFAQAFWLPKAGNSEEEYEDSYYPEGLREEELFDRESEYFRFAIADGATETSFSRLWAQLLTRAYGRGHLRNDQFKELLVPLQKAWRRRATRGHLPWYAEEKIRMGAFSSLLGLSLMNNNASDTWHGTYEVLAIGDSCIFQVRGDKVISCYPLHHSTQFTNRPVLISSKPDMDRVIFESINMYRGQWQTDDAYFLMTDALACWFLQECEHGNTPWRILRDLGARNQQPFPEWIINLRVNGLIKNDDVTLVRIDVG